MSNRRISKTSFHEIAIIVVGASAMLRRIQGGLKMRALTLGLAILVELAALAAYAVWPLGWEVPVGLRLLGAVACAGAVAFIWAAFAAPKARRRLPPRKRVALKATVFSGAALALVAAEDRGLAVAFALAATLQMVLAMRTGEL
jgi:ABC-type enterobactin transport system permease subunit